LDYRGVFRVGMDECALGHARATAQRK